MTVYAIADEVPKSCSRITPGRPYEISKGSGERVFAIIADDGKRLISPWKKSAHLEGGNWRRVEGAE